MLSKHQCHSNFIFRYQNVGILYSCIPNIQIFDIVIFEIGTFNLAIFDIGLLAIEIQRDIEILLLFTRFRSEKWMEVRVGDIVQLENNDSVTVGPDRLR